MKNNNHVQFEGKRIYIAPANPAGRVLAAKLKAQSANVVGFIDNLKVGDDIINDLNALAKDDVIIVAEGGFQQAICVTLRARGAHSNQVFIAQNEFFEHFQYHWRLRLQQAVLASKTMLFALLTEALSKLFPSKRVVYYTEDFIDNNTLIAWQYHAHIAPSAAVLVTKNLSTITNNKFPIVSVESWHGKLMLMRAKCVVIDHEYQGTFFDVVRRKRPFIQLFHGLPYKFLAGNHHFKHINDTAFVSSSRYFSEQIFPKRFKAKEFLTLGYPRNDVFFQHVEERCWVNTPEHQRPQTIIETTGPIWVYMPTFRDSGKFEMPFSLEQMQALCEREKRSLILKFHPFVAKQVVQNFELAEADHVVVALPGFPNIYLYPTHMNIYPWLADAEVLITDYSSVAFDFLLTDRPMIFFQYDYDSYYRQRGAFTVPTEDFAAGTVIKTTPDLLTELSQITTQSADTGAGKRSQLRNKLQLSSEMACPRLLARIREIT